LIGIEKEELVSVIA